MTSPETPGEAIGSNVNPHGVGDVTDKFRLDDTFVRKYRDRPSPFGYDGLGELSYVRTYSRVTPDGRNERWPDTVRRVVEGTYSLQRRHISRTGKYWDDHQAQKSAQEMYDRIFHLKFSPPGRGLWAMGTAITEEKRIFAALNNCAFVSTDNLANDLEKPFTFLMDASMLGVGAGFDTRGAGQIKIKSPDRARSVEIYQIPDTREGWVKSTGILLRSYFLGDPVVQFDYGLVRPAGVPIKTFGGTASGSGPLRDMHEDIRKVLDGRIGRPITVRDIVDIQNLIGKAVVAGNVRRTAEVAFGDPASSEFLDLKNYTVNPDRKEWGWASNNSIFAELGMSYEEVAERIRDNGEPGLAWLENMRAFGRMSEPANDKDKKAKGANPCLEQTLESYELCTLVENYLPRHKTKDDFLRTLKFAYLYAKTVTLGETHWPETNEVLMRNRRIGCSVSGVAQFIKQRGIAELRNWLNAGYQEIQRWDETYSNWLAIPLSKKTTSIKPSGTVSLLAGVTPGVHFPESEFYLRRVRVGKDSPLLSRLEAAGHKIEEDSYDPHSMVVHFPIHEPGLRGKAQVPMWEKLELTAFMQAHWADNQVSSTVNFDPKTEGHLIAPALDHFQFRLKGVSFLPSEGHGYVQAPYEAITAAQYAEEKARLKPVDFKNLGTGEGTGEKFCTTDTCSIQTPGHKTIFDPRSPQ
jgi:adenosylcobalamin-dependent ribonucleoside-triphosphate reductase